MFEKGFLERMNVRVMVYYICRGGVTGANTLRSVYFREPRDQGQRIQIKSWNRKKGKGKHTSLEVGAYLMASHLRFKKGRTSEREAVKGA